MKSDPGRNSYTVSLTKVHNVHSLSQKQVPGSWILKWLHKTSGFYVNDGWK